MTYANLSFVNNFDVDKKKKTRGSQLSQIRSHAARSASLSQQNGNRQSIFRDVTEQPKTATSVFRLQREGKIGIKEQVPTPLPGFGCYRTEVITFMPPWTQKGVGQAVDLWFQCLRDYEEPLWSSSNLDDVFQSLPRTVAEDPIIFLLFLSFFKDTSDYWRGTQTQSKTVIACQNRALSFLRERLDMPNPEKDDRVLYAIGLLASRAYVAGDMEQYKIHWQEFVRLANMRNLDVDMAFADVQNTATGMLYLFDTMCVLESNKSVFPLKDEPPNQFAGLTKDKVKQLMERFPEGFVALAEERVLSGYVLGLLARAVPRFVDDDTGFFFESDIKKPWTHREYLHCPGLGKLDSEWDRLIGLSMITLNSSVLRTVHHRIGPFSFQGARAEMTRRVVKCRSNTEAERECRIWLFMVAINAWRTQQSTNLSEEGRKLLKDFRWRFGFSLWEQVERIVQRFFWTPALTKWWRLHWDVLLD